MGTPAAQTGNARRTIARLCLTPFELGVFGAYGMMLAVFGPMHEPWADEAQAWMLARDNGLLPLLFHYLRHEGHPALWYLILRAAVLLHWSYSLFWLISCAFAWAGVWMLERYAPFPRYLKLLLPFTFYLAYQYSVVARSYVLFPLLAFAVAHIYRLPRSRPVAMGIALGLLANVSVHGTLVALAFAALYALRLRRHEVEVPPAREVRTGALIFAAAILFVAVCLWPTRNALPRVGPTLNRIIDAVSVPESTPPSSPRASAPAATVQAAPAPALVSPPATNLSAVTPGRAKLANLPAVLSYSFADWWPLALAFDLLVVIYLVRRRSIGFLAPVLILFIFLAMVYSAPWHYGLLWVTMLMVLWAVWDESEARADRVQNAVGLSLALLSLLQLSWTFRAFKLDAQEPTAPDLGVARYLKTLPPNTQIGGLGLAFGVQPYFKDKIFFNQHLTFAYFAPDPEQLTPEETVAAHPPLIVTDPLHAPTVQAGKYVEANRFCGTMFLPHGPLSPGCLLIYVPAAESAPGK